MIQQLPQNTYQIKPRAITAPGNYTLTVFGQFTDFKNYNHNQPMRTSLLMLAIVVALNAQAQSTKLPPRKTPASTPAARPALRSEDRPNSSKLPENRVVKTVQPPVKTTAPPPAHAPGPGLRQPRVSGYAYEKGDNLLNVGVGLSSYYYGTPFGVTYEAGIDKDISVGAQIDYNSSTYNDYNYYYGSSYYNNRWGYTATYFGLRASYHANRVLNIRGDKFDLYAGLGLGYISFKWKDDSYGRSVEYGSRAFFNYFIGGKYYFTNKFGAFVEFGYTGLSSTRVGLSAKF